MRTVDGVKYYTPREIADLGLITNSKGKSDYNFIHRLIQRGELVSVVFNPNSKIPYKFIPETAIEQYNDKFTQIVNP